MSHCPENPQGQPDGEISPEPTEAELLASLAAGKTEAFWNLWHRHQKPLRQLCLREMNGHAADAEDALSQVMLKARDRLPAAAAKIINLEAWLHRLARNLCIDLRRERQRRFEAAELWEITAPAELQSAPPLLHVEAEWEIQPFIAALPPPLRAAFELHLVREIPVQEVAAQLKLSPANVRKRVQLARERLRRDLAGRHAKNAHPQPVKKPVAPVTPPRPPPPAAKPRELFLTAAVIRTVRVPLPCGVEQLFHVFSNKPLFSPGRKIKSLQNYLRQHPDAFEKQLELAGLLHFVGDWKRAVAEWQSALAMRPDWPTALKLGDTLLQLGRREEAAEVFRQAKQGEFQSATTARYLAGWLAVCEKNSGLAGREFQAATALEPEDAVHWHGLALANRLADTPPEALSAVNRALNLNANDLVALSLGHEILLAAGQVGEAIRRAERLLQLAPQDLLTLRRLVACRCQWQLTEGVAGLETKRLLRRAAKLANNSFLVREPLAEYFVAQGEPEKALAVCVNFIERHPQCPHGRKKYAQLLAATSLPNPLSADLNVWKMPGLKCCNGACRSIELAEPLRA